MEMYPEGVHIQMQLGGYMSVFLIPQKAQKRLRKSSEKIMQWM